MDAEVTPTWALESAGCHLLRTVPSARQDATCGEVLAALRQQRFEYADVVVITDTDRRFLGMLSAGELRRRMQRHRFIA